MDPLTQGVLGTTLAQSLIQKNDDIKLVAVLGFLGGLAPDLDFLIRSESDPLLYLEYHRQFTHSLIFIPIGGFICAYLLWVIYFKKKLTLSKTTLYTTLGFGTHALLDACTAYGTQLLWPFSNYRVAWNNISIVDPLFTIPLFMMMVLTVIKKSQFIPRAALVYGVFYLLLGVVQRERAESIGMQIAKGRGHNPIRLESKPSFGNLLLWKTIYETNDKFYVDAIRLGLRPEIYKGDSIFKLEIKRDFPNLDPKSIQAKDIERFRFFSNDYIAKDPTSEEHVIDIRYSLIPNKITPMWGIRLTPSKSNQHTPFIIFPRDTKNSARVLWKMLSEDL